MGNVTILVDIFKRSRRKQAMQRFHEAYHAQMHRDYDKAVVKYQESLALYPTAEAHTFLGWTYSFLGELDSAIRECQCAIDLDPDFGNPYNDIGAYLIVQGQHDEAIPYLEQALQAKRYRAYHFAHYNLGRIYEHQGDLMSAYRHYRAAIRFEPRYLIAHQGMDRVRSTVNQRPTRQKRAR